ncbi:MAG: alpha/beta hydrolase [Wenzhouxiangellaceae bacterium]
MTDSQTQNRVVLVHGLWYRSTGMRPLAARLRRRGYHSTLFDYSSVYGHAAEHARDLYALARDHQHGPLHWVGHSMGGLVILRMLAEYSDLPPGRVVLLGSPVAGSGVARRLAGRWWSHWLVGASAELLGRGVRAPRSHAVGVIAGNRNLGVGRVLGGVSGHGDGTVSVSETRLEGASDHIVLPVTHTGMVFSASVAAQTDSFLQTGEFKHQD